MGYNQTPMRTRTLVLLLAAGLGSCGKKDETEVTTRKAKVERNDIRVFVTATGEIKPLVEIELKSKASGLVVQFKKEPGDPVEVDELIAELEPDTEKRNLEQAKANLKSAEAKLDLIQLQARTDLANALSEVAASREDEKQKRAELARLEQLTGNLVTQSELGTYRLNARLAEEKRKQAETRLELIRGRRDSDRKLAEADVLKANVSLEDAEERLRDTQIRSPIKGILLQKLIEEGQIISSGISANTGGTPMAVVADVSTFRVDANVDETDITHVKAGQSVKISLESGSRERFRGTVDRILPKAELDTTVVILKVRVTIEGDIFGKAYPGMTATVKILVDESMDTLLVPTAAVKQMKNRKVVYVPDGNGSSKAVPVKTGLDNGEKTEILKGLEENTEVYITHRSLPTRRGRF